MQTSSSPKKLPVPFADAGSKQDIPVDSQIGITGGRASYTDGFPPLTRTPLSAGGIPPFGTDFNGVLNDITASIRWQNAGSNYPFDAAFAASIAGYPKGAVIPSSLYDGYWLNTTEANSANPEVTNGSLTGWVPVETYGVTTVTGLAASSVTLTSLQAAKERIRLTGTLTSNINIVVPAWAKKWTVVNNCAGSFSVTIKTPTGAGVSIPTGMTAQIVGDGTNVIQDSFVIGLTGRLLNVQVITTSGNYVKTLGTTKAKAFALGAGGAGGGCTITGASQSSAGKGGNGGVYGWTTLLDMTSVSTVPCTIGSGGVGVNGADGGSGGNTSFGSYIAAPGGIGGSVGTATSAPSTTSSNEPGGDCTGSSVEISVKSSRGTGKIVIGTSPAQGLSGAGGSSPYGNGGGSINYGIGAQPGYGYGAGGGSVVNTGSVSTTQVGGNGSGGLIIVWEYA